MCLLHHTLLTPRGLNLCQIVMWNYIVNMIMYMYKTGCSARLENDIASGWFPRFCSELCIACCQFVQNKNYVSYVLRINSRTIFPRSCNWPCTLKNPCVGGWKISVGRMLLINLLGSSAHPPSLHLSLSYLWFSGKGLLFCLAGTVGVEPTHTTTKKSLVIFPSFHVSCKQKHWRKYTYSFCYIFMDL